MPRLLKFHYDAISADGKTVDGVECAASLEEVILKLLQKGLYPSRIETLSGLTEIAHERLSNFKQLRDKLSPPQPEPKPIVRKVPVFGVKINNLLIAAIVVLWLILVALNLLL